MFRHLALAPAHFEVWTGSGFELWEERLQFLTGSEAEQPQQRLLVEHGIADLFDQLEPHAQIERTIVGPDFLAEIDGSGSFGCRIFGRFRNAMPYSKPGGKGPKN
jgi:hypothetical protein